MTFSAERQETFCTLRTSPSPRLSARSQRGPTPPVRPSGSAPEDAQAAPCGPGSRGPARLFRQFGHALWSAQALLRRGVPQDLFYYIGGIGDEVLISAVFHEWVKRGRAPVTMMTRYPELFQNNPDVRRTLAHDPRLVALAQRLGRRVHYPVYIYDIVPETDSHPAPPYPIIARMCKVSGLEGPIAIRPCTCSDGVGEGGGAPRRAPGRRHEYGDRRAVSDAEQAVVPGAFPVCWWNSLSGRFDFVQLGSAGDPPLSGGFGPAGEDDASPVGGGSVAVSGRSSGPAWAC